MTLEASPDSMKRRREVRSLEPEWRFSFPTAVVFDDHYGRLIVSDTQRNRLQIYQQAQELPVGCAHHLVRLIPPAPPAMPQGAPFLPDMWLQCSWTSNLFSPCAEKLHPALHLFGRRGASSK